MQVFKRENAGALQASVSNLLQNELKAGIDAVFNNAFPADKIIRIDTLRLNLGTLDQQNFENEFKAQFLSELAKGLSVQKENLNHTNTAEELSNAQSLVNALIYFLEKGYFPWYQSATNMDDWETEILNDFTASEYQKLLNRVLTKQHANEVIIQRLVLQFSDKFLEELIIRSAPGFNDPWELLYKDIAFIINSFTERDAAIIRNKIWQFTFQALPDKKGEDLNFYTLQRLADYFGINGAAIRIKDERKVIKGLQTAAMQRVFKQLIVFLKQRDKNAAVVDKNVITSDTNNIISDKADGAQNEDNSTFGKNDVADESSPSSKKTNKNPSQKRDDARVIDGDVIFVNNSGIIILHPFFRSYFSDLDLFADGKFISNEAQQRAVLLLHYLATGETKVAEFNLALQKILCGYPLDDTLPDEITLSKKEKTESHNLLNAVIGHWAPLRNTSIQGFRGSFLQREGKLELKENGWQLTIEQKTLDILLGKLPWGISTIRLSWMERILNVDWY